LIDYYPKVEFVVWWIDVMNWDREPPMMRQSYGVHIQAAKYVAKMIDEKDAEVYRLLTEEFCPKDTSFFENLPSRSFYEGFLEGSN
jgi:hypothetical protein